MTTAAPIPLAGLARHDAYRLLLGQAREALADLLPEGEQAPEHTTLAALGLDESGHAKAAARLGLPALRPSDTPSRIAELLWSRISAVPDSGTARVEPVSEWQAEAFDLPAYLDRVGLQEPVEPTLDGLRALQWAHAMSIGFHNVDVLLKRPISLELPDIQRKLVQGRSCGTCVEHCLLFAAALERLGFQVTRLTGRPRIGRPVVLPKTHMALLVEIGDDRWLVDVGLGGAGPTEPVAIGTGEIAGRAPWRWRVVTEGDAYVLQTENRDHWVALHAFDLSPQRYVDYVLSCFYSTTYPGIPFARTVVAHRFSAQERHVANGDQYTCTSGTGERRTGRLDAGTLTEVFGVPAADARAVLGD